LGLQCDLGFTASWRDRAGPLNVNDQSARRDHGDHLKEIVTGREAAGISVALD